MFLLKRGRALAKAGWWDFDAGHVKPDENPIQQPWGAWGGTDVGRSRENNRLVLRGVTGWFQNGGGVGYEFQPLTPNWGFEFRTEISTYTATNLRLQVFIGINWTETGGTREKYQTYFMIDKGESGKNDTPYRRVDIVHKDRDALSAAIKAGFSMSQEEWAQPHTWRIRVFDDKTIVVWMDGIVRMAFTASDPNYQFGPRRRALNFQVGAGETWYINNFAVYDIYAPIPMGTANWTQDFYDDFDRANSATIGNGWTKLGSRSAINANSYAFSGNNDGGDAILRNTGITNGRQRIEGIIGGQSAPAVGNPQYSSLILCSNAAGTQGLMANVTRDDAWIGRFSTSLTSNLPTVTNLAFTRSLPSPAVGGDRVAFCVWNDQAWIEINGELIVYTDQNVHSVVPKTNSYAGLHVRRKNFLSSWSWNDVQILHRA